MRQALGEMTPFFWSDAEIIKWLNRSARKLCSAAQYLNSTWSPPNGNTVASQQEYELPDDCEVVTAVSYYSGVIYQLNPGAQRVVQQGGFVSGLPAEFYTRRGSLQLSPQVAGGARKVTNIPERTGVAKMVLGLYPVPSGSNPLYVDYVAYHPELKNPMDICLVPVDFEEAWTAYAIRLGKVKEGSQDEADIWKAIHDEGCEEFKNWNITNGQEVGPLVWGAAHNVYNTPASTVLVVDPTPGSV
ncbi:MAG: hypothetical protein ACRD3W_18585 [Terriglobales bacterium]